MREQILIPRSDREGQFFLGPMGSEDPSDFINAETNRVPYKTATIDLKIWKNAFRSWPSQMVKVEPGWNEWFHRVQKPYREMWAQMGIEQCLDLSTVDYGKDTSLLTAASYFWSDSLNAFMFSNGPMTPTLLDVKMLTGLKIDSTVNPAKLRDYVPKHQLIGKIQGGWSGYIKEHMKTGAVSHREHSAFLLMWLDRFVFCGPTIAPTTNMQTLAEQIADGGDIAIGHILLGETYAMLHATSEKIHQCSAINAGGPWWFVQSFLHVYFAKLQNRPAFTTIRYARDSYQEKAHLEQLKKEKSPIDPDTDYSTRRCTSIGEAIRMLAAMTSSDEATAAWFEIFYIGPNDQDQMWFAYDEANFADNPLSTDSIFENPSDISMKSVLGSTDSAKNFYACIHPRLLPSGIASGKKSKPPSYEFYHPSVAARQLGLGQVPIKLHFADKLRPRQPIDTALAYDRLLNIAIPEVAIVTTINLAPSSSKAWDLFWEEWHSHLFNLKVARYGVKFFSDFVSSSKV